MLLGCQVPAIGTPAVGVKAAKKGASNALSFTNA